MKLELTQNPATLKKQGQISLPQSSRPVRKLGQTIWMSWSKLPKSWGMEVEMVSVLSYELKFDY